MTAVVATAIVSVAEGRPADRATYAAGAGAGFVAEAAVPIVAGAAAIGAISPVTAAFLTTFIPATVSTGEYLVNQKVHGYTPTLNGAASAFIGGAIASAVGGRFARLPVGDMFSPQVQPFLRGIYKDLFIESAVVGGARSFLGSIADQLLENIIPTINKTRQNNSQVNSKVSINPIHALL